MLETIDHAQVAIPKGGEEQARAFYERLLGLPEQPKPPELAKRGGCWFETAAVKLHCGVEDPFSPALDMAVRDWGRSAKEEWVRTWQELPDGRPTMTRMFHR